MLQLDLYLFAAAVVHKAPSWIAELHLDLQDRCNLLYSLVCAQASNTETVC